MSFRIVASETAIRQLRKMAESTQRRVRSANLVLGDDPFRPRPKAHIRRIEGTNPPKDRLRVGAHRVVYAVEGDAVKVIEVFPRGRGYR